MGLSDMLWRMTPEEALALVRAETARRGWSRGQLADAAGVNAGNLSQILNGEQEPRLSTWLRITTALGLTFSSVDAGASERNRPLSVGEREMQGAPAGRPYAGALSSEDFAERITAAVAHAVASSVDRLGERIEGALARVAAGDAPRGARAPQPPRARKHAR